MLQATWRLWRLVAGITTEVASASSPWSLGVLLAQGDGVRGGALSEFENQLHQKSRYYSFSCVHTATYDRRRRGSVSCFLSHNARSAAAVELLMVKELAFAMDGTTYNQLTTLHAAGPE